VEIRTMTEADAESVLRLNEESVWALSPLDAEGLATARSRAWWALVCELDGQVGGFAIVYGPGSPYESINYAWHAVRSDDFVYLDRIAVDLQFRRRGIATAIYDAVEAAAQPRGRLLCEVYSSPPNIESLAFHKARGYVEVGHLMQPNGHETVMLEKVL
jgi:predicted GNAT superfamily acetyltransferase